MKLKNKKTGEIVEHIWWDSEIEQLCVEGEHMKFYNSLAELNEEWEDYEKPKTFWYIRCSGEVYEDESDAFTEHEEKHREIGNYFSSREEIERAVEKLKAWEKVERKWTILARLVMGWGR